MTDTATDRRKAADAKRLSEDPALCALLAEIEEEATAAFLASRGDPASLTAAYATAKAVQTLRTALQTRMDAGLVADDRGQRRARTD